MHWLKDYKVHWISFLLIVITQAALTTYITPASWPIVFTFLAFFAAFLILNNLVAAIILVLTWPARRNFHFSRYIKLLIAFSVVYFLSQVISFVVTVYRVH